MSTTANRGAGTAEDPWILTTPPGKSEYRAYRDGSADPPAVVCIVGTTELRYHLSCIDDLHAMLTAHGDWMLLGNADEQKPAADGTVEAWGRSSREPRRRVVRPQEGPPRALRQLRPPDPRAARARRGRAQRAQQPDARALSRTFRGPRS